MRHTIDAPSREISAGLFTFPLFVVCTVFSGSLFFLLLQRRRRSHAKDEKLGIRDEAENREKKSSKIRDSQYWNLLSAFYLTKTLLSAITICTLARLGAFSTFLICSVAENEESWALERVRKKWRKIKDKSIACEFAYTSGSEVEIPKFCKKFPSHTYITLVWWKWKSLGSWDSMCEAKTNIFRKCAERRRRARMGNFLFFVLFRENKF